VAVGAAMHRKISSWIGKSKNETNLPHVNSVRDFFDYFFLFGWVMDIATLAFQEKWAGCVSFCFGLLFVTFNQNKQP